MKNADFRVSDEAACDRSAFCTTRQAAARIGVSHRTVQMWAENGRLQAWKTAGGHRRITLASVERLIALRRAALAPQPARPIAPARGSVSVSGSAPAPGPQARTVLIVDDVPYFTKPASLAALRAAVTSRLPPAA